MPNLVPSSIVQAFLDTVARTPHKAAVCFEGQSITYEALADRARWWAGALRAWGLRLGDRIALFLENSVTFLAAYTGVHLVGGVVVLVNTQYRQVELRHILADSGARLVMTDHAHALEVARVAADLPDLEAVVVIEAAGGAAPPLPASVRPRWFDADEFLRAREGSGTVRVPQASDIALLAYTSGTTGRSKGAMLTHGNLAANARAVTAAWRWTADDVLLLALPLFHVHGLGVGMHGTLLTGGAVQLHRRFDAATIYEALLRGSAARAGDVTGIERVTMFFGVPTMYTRLIAEAQRRQPQVPAPLRLYVSGSAPLSVQTFAAFEQYFGQRILERYGMTETIMNLTNPYDGERRPGTVGMPFPGQEARIVDVRTREPVEDEHIGEIQVRGPHVFKGYWRRPDATAEAFDAKGWFNTGDLGRRSADGYFTITGRAKELIISGGYNVYPREVEEVLLTHPDVAEAAVFGLPDADLGEQVAAAVVQRAGAATPSAEALADHCRTRLAGYKKPRRVFFVDQLPRNALGKVQKHLLRERLSGS